MESRTILKPNRCVIGSSPMPRTIGEQHTGLAQLVEQAAKTENGTDSSDNSTSPKGGRAMVMSPAPCYFNSSNQVGVAEMKDAPRSGTGQGIAQYPSYVGLNPASRTI